MTTSAFRLVGGHPVLDFLNTVNDWRSGEPVDYFADFADALRFGEATGVLAGGESRRMASATSARELRQLRRLRSHLERIARALAEDSAPPAPDLAALSAMAAEASRAATVRWRGGVLQRAVGVAEAGPAALRYRIVLDAVALFTAPGQVACLKSCPSCGWFFLDTTKNASRRWCSMAMCGSTVKSRRYYWRRAGKRAPRRPLASGRAQVRHNAKAVSR